MYKDNTVININKYENYIRFFLYYKHISTDFHKYLISK